MTISKQKIEFAPTCKKEIWIKRQTLLKKVRQFFEDRNVLEVETPILSSACGTDPQLDYFEVENNRYLMTSPEFHMKRLLAADFGDIFQITKAFRKDEFGKHHNNEFSMVEWYRVGMTQDDLMNEVENLISEIIGYSIKAQRTRWIDAYQNYAHINPLSAQNKDFIKACEKLSIPIPTNVSSMTKEDWWDYLMIFAIEPILAKNGPEFILDYPESQAALAQTFVGDDGYTWARRFELFIDNIELCNGYTELTNFKEQEKRFFSDIEIRKKMNKPEPKIDTRFLSALKHGMPACSGVALGLDRLFMLALKKDEIKDVVLFPSVIA